jgi:DNA-binding beta-propeller fold protein YncE
VLWLAGILVASPASLPCDPKPKKKFQLAEEICEKRTTAGTASGFDDRVLNDGFLADASRFRHVRRGNDTLPFTDIAGNAFFCQIAEAFFSGLTNGTTPTTYSPKDNVTREQMAAFVSRTQDSALRRGNRRAALEQWWPPANSIDGAYYFPNPLLVKSDGIDLWLTVNNRGTEVVHYSPRSESIVEQYNVENALGLLIYRPGKVYVANNTSAGGGLWLLEQGRTTSLNVVLGNQPIGLTSDGANIWTANFGGSVSRVGVYNSGGVNAPYSNFSTGFSQPVGALFDGTNVWVTDFGDAKLKKLDSNGNILQSVLVGDGPELPVFDGSNIWVPSYYSSSVTVVRARDGLVLATLTGNGLASPIEAAFDGERILVTNNSANNVSLWKATDFTPIGFSPVLVTPYGVCSDGLYFWITSKANFLVAF